MGLVGCHTCCTISNGSDFWIRFRFCKWPSFSMGHRLSRGRRCSIGPCRIPDYNYDPGPQNLAPNFEETSFWLDVRPPDEAPAASGCPNGCTSPPSGCVIKGNNAFNTGDKIYHLPGDPYYTETVINPDYGERWFCTEQEAQANGWRHAKP